MTALEAQIKQLQLQSEKQRGGSAPTEAPQTKQRTGVGAASWPAGPRVNPQADAQIEPLEPTRFGLQKTVKCHLMSVANVALHPTKPVMVTASDDKTWKMWHMPAGDLIMCGEGHKDWVAGIDFHPGGTSLASSSGDGCVKLWDFERQKCVHTFHDHKKVRCGWPWLWAQAFHGRCCVRRAAGARLAREC